MKRLLECIVLAGAMIVTVSTSAQANVVPEPSTYLLFGIGVVGIAGYGYIKNRKK